MASPNGGSWQGQGWKGKTRGGLLGHKIFVFILRKSGLKAAYVLLKVVSFYYCIFAPSATRSIYAYFRAVQQYSPWKSVKSVYRNFYLFGQTLLDKVAVISGMNTPFTYSFDGKHHLKQLSEIGQGGILISAHLGNWEIAGFFLKEINLKVNIVMFEAEHIKIKDYLGKVMQNQNVKIIPIKQDLSHIFLINKALREKEVICMHGDRFVEGGRITAMDFMGKKAFFPMGPFTMAAKLGVPYTFVYAVKASDKHYHMSATPLQTAERQPMEILHNYVTSLESKINDYPLQWFNYYDFWSENLKGGIFEKPKQQHEKISH